MSPVLDTLFIGLVLALAYTSWSGISPGGIIVPGYFALYLDQPLRCGITLVGALICLAVYKFLSRHFLLFGKRRFVILLLLGGTAAQLWMLLFPRLAPEMPDLRVVGWVIPGLLANALEKQKPVPTLASLATVSVLTYLLSEAVSRLF